MSEKKKISVVVPIYNEVAMVEEICHRIRTVCRSLERSDYEHVFFDDGSTDGTRAAIEAICAQWEDVKAVFYTKNFGYLKSTFYCMQQAQGDCAIIVHADLQNPPEVIPEFVAAWEAGAQVVLGVKNQSHEKKWMYFLRSVFYFLMIRVFGVPLIPHATEFELFDRSFLDILEKIHVDTPFLRGIVQEYAANQVCVTYTQDARKKGRSKFNLRKYYEFAMCGITQYSRVLPRRIMLASAIALAVVVAELLVTAICLFPHAELLVILNAIVLRCLLAGMCLLMGVVGLVLEFVIAGKGSAGDKPLILEEKRIRYDRWRNEE